MHLRSNNLPTWYVYILECSDNTFYIGSTNNLEKRLVAHNTLKSGARYTKIRRPVIIKYYEKVKTKSEALKREYVLKQFTRAEKFNLINSFMKKTQKTKKTAKKKKLVMVSGGFDPVHVGHLRMFQEAKKLGDELLVVLNCDAWLVRKKGKAFMSAEDRAEIIKGFECVDHVHVLESDRHDVGEAIEKFKPHIFANGGDRRAETDIPESEVCKKYGVKMVFNVGGDKLRSSSELLKKYVV